MAVNSQELEIRLKANVADLKKGLNDAKGDFGKMSEAVGDSIEKMSQAMKLKVAKGMASSFQPVIEQAKELRNQLKELAASSSVTPRQTKGADTSTTRLLNDISGVTQRETLKQATAEMSNLTKAERDLFVEQNRFNKNYTTQLAAVKQVTIASQELHSEWISGRYALYDVSSALQNASQNVLNFTGAVYEAQFAQEAAFSQVQRVQVDADPTQLKALKEELIDLTKVIPKTFTEISKIAMLGSQLGIATQNLGKFTDTVAKFSAITGVSVEQTATTFGKLANLLNLTADEYDNLGSSIAFVGVNAAATETDILSSSRQISAVGTAAGLSASDVIGLAAALSSLGTSPEEARGVLVPTFNAMDRAIRTFSETTGYGSDELTVFAATAGMTSKQFVDAWGDKKDGGATKAFQAFISGLGKGNTSKILNQLGLDGVRTSKGLTALGQNAVQTFEMMDDAATGMVMGDYLDKSFAKTVDDISVRLQLLGAAVQEAFAAMAGNEQILGAIGAGIDSLKNLISGASDAMKGPFTSGVAGVILALTGLIGILLGVGSAIAISIASLYALRVAVVGLGKDSMFANNGLLQFIASLLRIPGASATATASLATMGKVAKATMIGLPALFIGVAVVEGIFTAISNSADRAAKKTEEYFGDLTGLQDAMKLDTANADPADKSLTRFNVTVQQMTEEGKKASRMADDLSEVLYGVADAADVASGKTKESSLVFGEAAVEYLRGQLQASDGFKKSLEDPAFAQYFNMIGADIDKALSIAASDGEQAVGQYFYDLKVAAEKAGKDLPDLANLAPFDPIAAVSGTAEYTNAIEYLVDGLSGVRAAAKKAADGNSIFKKTSEESATEAAKLTSELQAQIDAAFVAAKAQGAIEDALFGLGKTMQDSKDDFSTLTESGRQNFDALQKVIASYVASSRGDSKQLANDLTGLKTAMIQAGIGGAAAFLILDQAIAQTGETADTTTLPSIQSLIEGMSKVDSRAGTAKTALQRLQEQIEKTFRTTVARNDVQDAIASLNQSMAEGGKIFSSYSETGRANINALLDTIDQLAVQSNGNTKVFANSLASLKKALQDIGAPASAIKIIDKELAKLGVTAKASASQVKQFKLALDSVGDGSLLAISEAASQLQGRLSSLFSSVIAGRKANLELSAGYEQMATRIREARLEIASINAEISEMTADKAILEYQLKIALKYGDTLRANKIQAEIDKAQASINEKNTSLKTAQEALTPTTAESQLMLLNTLESQANNIYASFSRMLIEGNKNKTQMKTWVEEQTKLYYDQAIQAGLSEEEAAKLAGTIKKDLMAAIKKVPKLSVDTKGANADVNALKANIASITGKTVTITTRYLTEYGVNPVSAPAPKVTTKKVVKAATGGLIVGPGTGTSDSVPAQLSNGEFVISAAAVQTYGVDFMNSLNNMRPVQATTSNTMVQSQQSSNMVYLSPDDRALLRSAIDRPVNLYADSTKIATTANAGNVLLAQRGSN